MSIFGSGAFIVMEGIHGAEKDIQIGLVKKALKKEGYKVWTTKEPSDEEGSLGAYIRNRLLLHDDIDRTELIDLFVMDRIEHCKEIRRHVENDEIVISSRYIHSNIVYNTDGCLGEMSYVLDKNFSRREILIPDKVIYIDIDPENSLSDLLKKEQLGYFEDQDSEMYRERYKWVFDNLKFLQRSYKIIDGTQKRKTICKEIVNYIILD